MANEALAAANSKTSEDMGPGPNDSSKRTEPELEHVDDEIDDGGNAQPPMSDNKVSALVDVSPAIPAGEGPSRNKGKGPDPRNWGAVDSLIDFSENDLDAQREAFNNYAEINRVFKEDRKSTPRGFFDNVPSTEPKPMVRTESPEIAFEPLLQNKGTTRKPPGRAKNTNTEQIVELESQLSRLRQSENPDQLPSKRHSSRAKHVAEENIVNLMRGKTLKPSSTEHRGVTPGRIAAGSYIDKAIRGAARLSQKPPSDPSDSSPSSSSSDERGSDDTDGTGTGGRQSSAAARHRRMSSRRSSGRRSHMLLKPIPPTKYTGEPSANAFSRFVREGSAYVKMGRVKPADQVFFLSYYLGGKASDFYNQVVVRDEESYTLETFFKELFDFCFPQDFRNKQRKRLNRCYQTDKTVAEHVAEFAQIYDTIGALEGQEKIVKLWNSFRANIQQEMYRKELDPEVSSWEEVVNSAKRAEVLLNLKPHEDSSSSTSEDEESRKRTLKSWKKDSRHASDRLEQVDESGGHIELKQPTDAVRASSVDVGTNNANTHSERKMSAERRNEFLAKGLCFKCEEQGHLARDCPKGNIVKSKRKGHPPGFGTHALKFSDQELALLESTN